MATTFLAPSSVQDRGQLGRFLAAKGQHICDFFLFMVRDHVRWWYLMWWEFKHYVGLRNSPTREGIQKSYSLPWRTEDTRRGSGPRNWWKAILAGIVVLQPIAVQFSLLLRTNPLMEPLVRVFAPWSIWALVLGMMVVTAIVTFGTLLFWHKNFISFVSVDPILFRLESVRSERIKHCQAASTWPCCILSQCIRSLPFGDGQVTRAIETKKDFKTIMMEIDGPVEEIENYSVYQSTEGWHIGRLDTKHGKSWLFSIVRSSKGGRQLSLTHNHTIVEDISIKMHNQDITQAVEMNLPDLVSKVFTIPEFHTSNYAGCLPSVPLHCQVVCIEGCVQIIIRLFRSCGVLHSAISNHSDYSNDQDVQSKSTKSKEVARSLKIRKILVHLSDNAALTLPEKQELYRACRYTKHICRSLPKKLLAGQMQIQVDSFLLTLQDGILEAIKKPGAEERVPEIHFVEPPCLPVGPQGTATLEVSLGGWLYPWRLIIIHNGVVCGDLLFPSQCEKSRTDSICTEDELSVGDEEQGQILHVVVVVKETQRRMERMVKLGQRRAGTINFTIAGKRGSLTPSTCSGVPLLVLPPDAAQEVNSIFIKMVKQQEAIGTCTEDVKVHTWSNSFKGMVLDVECLLSAVESWKKWSGVPSHCRQRYIIMLKNTMQYMAQHELWETMAFLLRHFIRNSGSMHVTGIQVIESQMTTSFLKHLYVISNHIKGARTTTVLNQQNHGAENPSGNHTRAVLQQAPAEGVGTEHTSQGDQTLPTNTNGNRQLTMGWKVNTSLHSGASLDAKVNERADKLAPTSAVEASGRIPVTWEQQPFGAKETRLLARNWIWYGFEDRSLEARYSLFVNRERAVLDLAMTLMKVLSCSIALFQIYPLVGRLAEPLIWNVLATHLILIPLLWGDVHKEWREVVVLVARLMRMGLMLLWWFMDWNYMEGLKNTGQRVSLDAGRLTWDALVFPVWLQVKFCVHLVLGALETVLLLLPGWGSSDSRIPYQVLVSYFLSCAVVFAVERSRRRAFILSNGI